MAEIRPVLLRWVIGFFAVVLAPGCEGTRSVSYRYGASPVAAGKAKGGAGAVEGGTLGSSAAAGEGGAPTLENSAGARAGEGAASGAGGEASASCNTAEDCGASSDCAIPRCESGSCSTFFVPRGTFVHFGATACHATVCDGNGSTAQVVDARNLPSSAPACRLSSCAEDGQVKLTLAPTGTSCGTNAGQRCDPSGECVDCLGVADCAAGQVCVSGHCQEPAASCANQHKDGNETDIDCGGACPPCAVGGDCYRDLDCVSQACDYYAPGRCLASHCSDRHRNADETDVDCGGSSCGPCQGTSACSVNTDCSSGLCHDLFHFCLADHCSSGKQDGGETGVDCGGGCYGCADGNSCVSNGDCLSKACDAINLTCIADHCQDHHQDVDETDVDCGGVTCTPCAGGKKCSTNLDCLSGLSCPESPPKVCY